MKNAKRWLAVILAVTLLGSNAIYQLGTTLSANETEAVTESQQDESENAVAVQEGTQQEDTGKATVQEVTPQEDKSDASAQESKPVQEEQQTKETQTESQTPAAVEAPQAEQTQQAQQAAPANAGQSEPEAQPKTPVAQTYDVKINKPDLDGGQIKVWGTDGIQTDVTSYDGNNQYVKEVTEGEDFNFQITRNDGFEIENVTVNGAQIAPESTDGNVSTYKLSGVAEEKAITITYNRVETPTEENQDGEAAADEGQKDDAVTEQGGQQADDKVNTASLNDAKETAETHEDTATEKWITVGKSVTLSSENYQYGNYSHEWSIDEDSQEIVPKSGWGSSITVTGLKEGTATVKDKVTWTTGVFWQQEHEDTITYTVHVIPKESAKSITINGADSVTQFKDINLTYTLTPAGAEGTVQWSSSNEDILTVDSSGKVTGLRRGQATVTANVYSGQSLLCSATKTIQVVEDTTVTGEFATVYYLLDPTKDANSNDTGNWGPAYGTAKVNVTGATWTGGRNCFDNVDQRVVSWPNGTNVVTRNSEAWNQIFNNYKSSVEQQLGVTITKDDVVSITLRPAKISRNNYSNPDKHLDCNVDVNCKGVSIVHYYLLDKSSDPNSTEYVHQGSKSYINGNKTNPETVTGKSFPTTKTGTDGATYTFSGWYTDQELTQPATFPYTVNSNVNFYAKYVAGRQVVYNLNGGSFSDGSSLTEKHNEGENVVVKSEPTRKGYKFTGWTVEGLDGVSSINSGASFQMPNNNVTITANWEEQKIEDFIKLTPTDVTEVYNGEAHAAGIATASAKKAEANLDGVKIEYQKADGTWTESPAEITATNVADSTTVKVRVTSENYVGKLEKSEKLTITKRPVTISVANAEKYYGTKDPAFAAAAMSGQVSGELTDVDLSVSRSDAGNDTLGTHENVLSISQSKEELEAAYTNYTFTVTPADFTVNENKTALTVSAADVTKVYDGTSYGITAVASIEGATIKYKDKDGKYTLDVSPVRKNVGETTVEFEASLYGYKTVTGKAMIKITKRPVTITAANSWKYYGNDDPEFQDAIMNNQVGNELDGIDLSVIRTNAQVNKVGTYKEVLTINQSKETLEEDYTNYTFAINPGDFEIKTNDQDVLRVGATNVSKTYDGQPLGVTATATLEGAAIKYKDADGNYTLDESPTRTEYGETTVEFKASLEGYADAYGSATIKIDKRPVEIKAANASKEYGNADPAFKDAKMSGQVTGELTDIDLSVSRSDVGTVDGEKVGSHSNVLNISKTKAELEEVYTNYTFTVVPADFTINTNETALTVSAEDVEKTYDGTSYGITAVAKVNGAVNNNVTIKYKDKDGNYTLDASPTRKNVGETTVEFEASLYGYKTVTGKATIKITKRPVTISVANAEKYYGTEDPAFAAATMSGQVSGELTDVDLSVIRTNAAVNKVGTYEKVLTINQTKKKLEEANGNYTFTINPGNFEIKTNDQGALKVSAANVEETYDGQSHGVTAVASIEGATIKYKDANGNYTLDESPTRTEYGETTVEFKASLEGYADAYGSATIKINKRPVEIKAESASKTYGEEDPEFAAAAMSGQVSGELTDVDLSVSRSDAGNDTLGTHENVLSISQSKEELEAAYTNYTFTVTPADFTVNENKTALTVSAADVTKVYDGTSYGITAVASIEGATIKYKDKDGKYTLDVSPVRKNVGETTVEFEASLYGYKTVTGKATIEITKRPVKVVTYGNTKVYDGKPLTAGGEVNGLVDGETVSFAITGTQTLVGSSNNTYTLEWNKSADKDNYQVLPESVGVLEVTPQSINPGPNPENPDPSYDGIQIDSPSDVEYDGQAHKWSPTVTDKNGNALTESTDYEVSYDKDDFTDVKTITVTIIGKGNYTGTVTRVYNILAAPLIIRTEKAEKTYDGKPLTNENMTIEGLKNGEVVVHKTTGSQTEVGNSDNTYELDWKSKETTAKESNYIIKEVSLGKLVVKETEDEIVVTTTGGTFTYDGQPHGATVEVSELPEGYTLQTAESDATATDVTTEAVTADADRLVIVNAAGVDVTANLKITRVTGEIVVNPATVTVTTPNASKVYDGTPLTAAGTITGLVNGETVSFATTGTITNVGTATNSYSLVWDQTAKATNYTVSENLGTLTVTAPANNNPSVTPTPPDNPRPNNPTRPSGQTTEPTGNAFVDNVVTPVVETVKEKAAKIQEVFNSDDEDVPLADQNLDNHKCCILHFLIMLITLLVYALATKSMKKRQKKLHEVREELDCELARRGLPLSREKE